MRERRLLIEMFCFLGLLLLFNSCKPAKSDEVIPELLIEEVKVNEPYLYGVPPEPPYQDVEVTITSNITDGCNLSKEKLIGYIISTEEGTFSDYNVLLQDENGVRHKCYIDTNSTSNVDLKSLRYIFIPGNKVEMKVEYCGSGEFIYVMNMKNLRR